MINVKFFASVRERFGRSETQIAATESLTVAGVWRTVSDSDTMPPNLLAAVNFNYAQSDTGVQDGDEVAFFPRVTGG